MYKNVKRVSVKPEKNILKFLKYFMKYFRAKKFMKFYITSYMVIIGHLHENKCCGMWSYAKFLLQYF